MAARANAESASRLSTSPRFGRHRGARLSTPSPRVSQGEQVRKKRKSPSVTMRFFRSPLSRMLLSPRMQLPRTQIRSPSVRDIDLNVEPEYSQENVESGSHLLENAEIGSPVPENAESGSHVIGNAENVSLVPENGSNLDGNSHTQQNAQRNIVSNENRRAIFEALLARATNGEVSSHVKAEVLVQFSVHIRTVQRI
ncbi:hypothetical protein BS78_09G228700 [Paspalum vaginatum]|nr:hypothetical protein BS78_09G228700 [Paspalum vaginatum]